MSKPLKKYKARIFGDVYTIVSDEDDGFVLEVVHKVDLMMKEIATKHPTMVDAKKIAVLAALKATEELLSMQHGLQKEQIHCEKIMTLLNNEDEVSL